MGETPQKKIFCNLEGYSQQQEESLKDWISWWSALQEQPPQQKQCFADSELLRGICETSAQEWGVSEVLEESQKWGDFQRAWNAWLVAFERWLTKKHPALKSNVPSRLTPRTYSQALFLAGLQSEKQHDPTWFKGHAGLIAIAALEGDVEFFFDRFAKAKRHKGEPPQLQFYLMAAWMTAGLWTATDKACVDFILKRWDFKRGTTGSVRQAWIELGLWHSSLPIIKGWQWVENGRKLENPKPIYFPTRLPKV